MPDQADSSGLEGANPSQDTPILCEHAAVIRRLQRRVIADVVEIGRRLCECKPLVGHGHWLPWLKREFDLSERTARNFINAYKLVEGKPETVADLRIDVSALYLLARPSVPEEIRVEVLREAALRPISRAEVKAMLVPSATKRRESSRNCLVPSRRKSSMKDRRISSLQFKMRTFEGRGAARLAPYSLHWMPWKLWENCRSEESFPQFRQNTCLRLSPVSNAVKSFATSSVENFLAPKRGASVSSTKKPN